MQVCIVFVHLLSMRALQIIAICETKEEDCESQVLFWRNLNHVMEVCDLDPPDFAGFMSDEAGANWSAIRTVYNGGPKNVLEGRERSCLFHWEQSLQKYNRKWIPVDKQQVHIAMCESWRLAKSKDQATQEVIKIKDWWKRNLNMESIKHLQRWLKWWETRINHWGSLDSNVSFSKFCKV